METRLGFVTASVLVLGLSASAQATLILLGQGTSQHDTYEYNLIYDTDLDITWFDYFYGYHTWDETKAWADALLVDFGGYLFNDWRLPKTIDKGNDGCNYGLSGTDCGYNVDTSTGEMAHL
jgi:hypothetical protein